LFETQKELKHDICHILILTKKQPLYKVKYYEKPSINFLT